ncbi:DUF1116 domain-containing protein [bacterium]|nr:DUF1116 domain-containing protein [Candidatus Omnitrophota bacterium]MBU2528573.1 DUF1116 domain-containing protein [bacterium]MBU3930347.1 DUF1116 domain-containing protein [bacterium]MBU4123487.1 DUF1116 domain-containing protein [bacterium]
MTMFKNDKIINLGVDIFYDALKKQLADVRNAGFTPFAGGDTGMAALLDSLEQIKGEIDAANAEGIRRINESTPVLIATARAKDVIPGMKKNLILHAGPPVAKEKMCGPVMGAALGAIVYEGLAADLKEAKVLVDRGEIDFSPCHHHSTVGPMAGVVSSSMWVYVVENKKFGNKAYCPLNEGLGKVLRFGANSPGVLKHLKWMEDVLAPSINEALRQSPNGIDIKSITSQALMMGDECHNRNVAATDILIKELIPLLLKTGIAKSVIKEIIDFIASNPHSYLNVSMAACKATADTIAGLEKSTLVSVMARNGTELGIRVAGCRDEWFTAPAGIPKGLYFAGFDETDSNPDLGDSTISEAAGIGANAMACAPAIVKFVGGTPSDAMKFTKQTYDICAGESSNFQIPYLNFRGTPVGFDIRKIVARQQPPFINTGIAHKDAGIGQIGAGLLYAPIECFKSALKRFAEKTLPQK